MARVHCLPARSRPPRPLPSNPPDQTARMPAGRGWSTWSRSLRSRSMSAGESRSTPPRPRSLGGAGGGRAGQGLPDALRHSRSGGASGWPSAGRPACDNARCTPGAPPSAAGCPWGQMDARPTGPVRALQNEQSPRAGQAARGPGAGHGAGAAPGPEVTWPHRCTRIRTHPAVPPRPLRLPARRRNREHPSRVTRGSALCRPAGGAPLRAADFELCEQRPAEGWGAGQRWGGTRTGVPPADWGMAAVRAFHLCQGFETALF